MATIGSAKATLVNKIDSLTSTATAKDTIFLAKALKENSSLNNFVWQGAWAATTAYATDDVVSNGGSTYMCIVAHTSGASFSVGSNWDMMAGAGTDGTDGTDGASGIPSGGTVGQVVTNTASGAGGWADAAGGGKVLQVLQTYKTDKWSTTSSGLQDISGLSVTITPSSTTSKILITSTVAGYGHNDGPNLRLVRDSTEIGLADSSSSHSRMSFSGQFYSGDGASSHNMMMNNNATYLDSPSTTSATTYKVVLYNTGNNVNVNAQENDANSQVGTRSVSHITVMEIGA